MIPAADLMGLVVLLCLGGGAGFAIRVAWKTYTRREAEKRQHEAWVRWHMERRPSVPPR